MRNLILVGCMMVLCACSGVTQKPKPETAWQREAKFREFLNASMTESLDSSRYVLDTLLKFYAGDSAAMHQLVDFLTPPLSDPNSQLRNEELYVPLLQAIIASPFYDTTAKVRPQYQLDMAMKNRVGQPAADFEYTLADGKRGMLHQVDAPFTLVYINNPDCHACEEILELISTSRVITSQLGSGKLKIVAIYPDADLAAWRKHLPDVPTDWINGYDADLALRKTESYDLRAIPSLYLLDKDKKVLLKDCTSVDMIEAYLVQNNR